MGGRSNIVNSLMAGMCISIGGYAFLLSENKFIGSVLFSIGLFLICAKGFDLFTGKVCYIDASIDAAKYILTVLSFNLIGCFIFGKLSRVMNPTLIQTANNIGSKKVLELPIQTFLLAIMCNILIYFAVNIYKTGIDSVVKYLGIIICVVVFINCGFEHCIANMYYLSVADFNFEYIFFMIINIVGNATGGILIYRIDELRKVVK